MQTMGWYLRRLTAMSAPEVMWRVRGVVRDLTDRARLPLGLYPRVPPSLSLDSPGMTGFRASDVEVGEWSAAAPSSPERRWADSLARRADEVVDNRLTFFSLERQHLGSPVDWNRDHEAGKAAPVRVATGIDYRDFRVAGDAKVVWEPNRHHQLVILGRAYRATGDHRYARALVAQLESWMSQCPFGMGMNWRSPLELAIRIINWVWAIDLISESGQLAGDRGQDLLQSAYLHIWEISRKYSRGSSANNHLIGEAAGVFVAASYFRGFPESARWRAESRTILCEEILRQSTPTGCSRELALGYQYFVLGFFMIAAAVGRRLDEPFPAPYLDRLERMLEFVHAMLQAGTPLSPFGDGDDGYVLDLADDPRDPRWLLATGAALFRRPDFKASCSRHEESVRWLFGRRGEAEYAALAAPRRGRLESRAFPETGLYLLQAGERGERSAISVLFDCGPLGYGALAAHGHADALAFGLRVSGAEVLVDPGTFDYFAHRRWRDYFRSTRAHNTASVDGRDQSEMAGLFLWGRRANARCVTWEPAPKGGRVVGEHDGYRRLADPVIHRRGIELDGEVGRIVVTDDFTAAAEHTVEILFHFAESCRVESLGRNRFAAELPGQRLVFELDDRLAVTALSGSENPIAGWVSRRYHERRAVTTLIAQAKIRGDARFACAITVGSQAAEPSEHVAEGAGDGS